MKNQFQQLNNFLAAKNAFLAEETRGNQPIIQAAAPTPENQTTAQDALATAQAAIEAEANKKRMEKIFLFGGIGLALYLMFK